MTQITKDEFDNLPDALKAKFKPDGDNYLLQEEDVTGLKTKIEEFKKEKLKLASIQKLLDEGFDLDAAKKALETVRSAEDEKLKAAGEFETLKKKLEERHTQELAKATAERERLMTNLKRERLQNYLVEKGVLADRAAYAFVDIGEQIELVSDDSGFSLKLKGGIGDAKELETVVESLKTKSPFLFSANGASGSGASGSNGGGGTTKKTATKAEVAQMSPSDKANFYKSGGEVTDFQ